MLYNECSIFLSLEIKFQFQDNWNIGILIREIFLVEVKCIFAFQKL